MGWAALALRRHHAKTPPSCVSTNDFQSLMFVGDQMGNANIYRFPAIHQVQGSLTLRSFAPEINALAIWGMNYNPDQQLIKVAKDEKSEVSF